jgi:hypothetical protein
MAKRKIDVKWTHERTESGPGTYQIFNIDFGTGIEGGGPMDNCTAWIEVVGIMFSTGSPNGAFRRACSMRMESGSLDPNPLPAEAFGTQENWPIVGTGAQYIGNIQFTEGSSSLSVEWTGPQAPGVTTHVFFEMRLMAYQNA